MTIEDTIGLVGQIFFFGFVFNILWHLPHSLLYKTVYEVSLKRFVWLNLSMPFKDGFFICLFYSITVLMFQNWYILGDIRQLAVFVIISLIFAFTVEKVSLRLKRWEYLPSMPTILGVGITPLLEVAVTGILAFWAVFYL